jgi:C-terminal domain of alpha-glycerophosphate oxidase
MVLAVVLLHMYTADIVADLQYCYYFACASYHTKQEYAVKAVDVLARRTRLAFVDATAAAAAAPRVVEIMSESLGWGRARRAEELKECSVFLQTMSAGVEPKLHHTDTHTSSSSSSSRSKSAAAPAAAVAAAKQTGGAAAASA